MKKATKEMIDFLIHHFQRHWIKWLVGIIVVGIVISSCEIPTPWGVIKKGPVKLPFMKQEAPQ